MRRVMVLCLVCWLNQAAWSQEVLVSAPQKVTAGLSRVEVLGRSSQGILIRHVVRDEDQIVAFYDNMQMHWKRNVPQKERNSNMEEIMLHGDSILFFYTIANKGATLLKAFKTHTRIESPGNALIIDTISRNYISNMPRISFARNVIKNLILVWFEDPNFENNKLVHAICLDHRMQRIWQAVLPISGFEYPEVLSAVLDSTGRAVFVSGEFKVRNYNNDFQYTAVMISRISRQGVVLGHRKITEGSFLFSECLVREDPRSGRLALAGMYSTEVGVESSGAYFMQYDLETDSLLFKRFEPHSTEFVSQLTGNTPPRKQDGFENFKPRELIITRNAGAVFIAQAESVSSESYSNPPIGGFGGAAGFTVNYYHYDDLVVYSFKGNGELEWKQILHKKQSTEGDGGYYSSFCTLIGSSRLNLIYNDVVNGQTTIATYALDTQGLYKRNEIFSADRKGIMVAPRHSRQISLNEMILPSIKKNYLQFVKITF